MKGYYVIPTKDEPIEFIGRGCKNRALKKATELFLEGDSEVFVKQFDDDDPDGFFASGEIIWGKDLERGF